MINWQYYPRSHKVTPELHLIVEAFRVAEDLLKGGLHSNQALALIAEELQKSGFQVETGKKKAEKINRPVLYGREGRIDKSFEVDAFHEASGTVLEVEAGRAVVNNQFLKDLFEACMMEDVNYLAIAVLNKYERNNNKDFEDVNLFFDTLYTNGRLILPLKGVLVIGY